MSEILKALTSTGSPFEIHTLDDGQRVFRSAPPTLSALYERARKRPQDAVVLVHDGKRITLADLFRAAGAISQLCAHHGRSRRQRRIAIVLPNCPELAAALVGITESGWAAVLVPFGMDVEDLALYLSMTDCDMALTTAEVAAPLASASGRPCLTVTWKDVVRHEAGSGSVEVPHSTESSAADLDSEAPAIIAFTSGSSGRPKAVVISHRAQITGLWNMMLASAWAARRNRHLEGASSAARPGSSPCTLLLAPLTHVGGYAQLLLTLAMSGRIVLLPHWDARLACELARRENATALTGATPAMIREVLAIEPSGERPLPIESFGIHGTAFRRSLMEEIAGRVPAARFSTGYGMTETSGSIAATSGAEFLMRPDICGPVLPTVDIEIVDASGKRLPAGEPGEIRVRGAMLFTAYHQAGLEFRPRSPHSWHETGDIGVLDESGFLTLLERSCDAINLGSRGIHCSEIERFIDERRYGEDVIAVGTREGKHLLIGIVSARMDIDAEQLKHGIQEAFQLPEDWITVVCRPDFPRTASGKINRRELVALAENAGMCIPSATE